MNYGDLIKDAFWITLRNRYFGFFVGLGSGVVAGLILLPLLIVAIAILGTFNHSYWTLAYLRLTTEGGTIQP